MAQVIDESMPADIPQEIIQDWETQDGTASAGYPAVVNSIAGNLPPEYAQIINNEAQQIGAVTQNDAWRALYLKACHYRRIMRMKPYSEDIQKIVFAKHHNFGGPLVGFLEGILGSRDTEWADSSALCLLNFSNYYSRHTYLLEDKTGVIKDPAVSFDGTKILFAWSRREGSSRFFMGTGFKLYELDVANPAGYRQITSNPPGLTVSDIEPCYLQNGDIVFNSSRCYGMVDCAFNIVCNLYICNSEGKYLRRVGYDQVHTFYPVLMSDGKVMYTRWEYNDRLLTSAMGLFTMNPDGTHQTEYFGNQTNWPMTIIHGRQIPDTRKVIAVAGGHHAPYSGDLMIIDPNIARNGLSAIQFIAPLREPPANPGYETNGGVRFLFQNPLPLDEDNFIVSWRPDDAAYTKFKLYFMNIDGSRELLAWDNQSVSQPVLLKARPIPPMPAISVDYTQNTGSFTMQDIYEGTGLLKGGYFGGSATPVPRGTVKKLRVIAIDYRINNAIGHTGTTGFTETPVARWTGSWEAKRILGETPVYEDGSAAFIVPARTPVYFQAIDSNGYVVQTMRSWATLQPGESFSCFGCHEDKNLAPPVSGVAMAGKPKPLEPFNGIENKSFHYAKYVQPIWDKHCISCHNASHSSGVDLRGDRVWSGDLDPTLWPDDTEARRFWSRSYLTLTQQQKKYVDWITIFSQVTPLRAYPPGASTSFLMTKILAGDHHGVSLSKAEKEIVACWIDLCIPHSGYYTDDMTSEDSASFEKSMDNRRTHEALEKINIEEFIAAGQYGNSSAKIRDTDKKIHGSRTTAISEFKIRFLARERVLSVDFPCGGEFMLLDLRGRQIANLDIKEGVSSMAIPLPGTISRGLYVARFAGKNSIKHSMISIVR